ncbi:MAG TPA: divalent metal cation transporter [Patescibacteria group bacterium]|nr:divalent metal cation transporter [Patescibacteria group bacterium]
MDNIHNKNKNKRTFTLSEFRKEVGLPLIVVRKLVVKGEIEAHRAVDGTLRIAEEEIHDIKGLLKDPKEKTKIYLKTLGPGLITGASDDDPSGIGTYSAVGAKFGFGIIWLAAWLLPMMLAVQEVCARIGVVTNKGLAGVLQRHYRKKIVFFAVLLLIIVNIVNIGADLGAMGASLEMITGINFYFSVIIFATVSILFEVFIGYHIYAKFLKWLSFSVLAYIVTGLIVHPNWLTVLKSSFIPHFSWDEEYIFATIAVFGTSITPYLFFWQASEEVEENKLAHRIFFKNKKALHGRITRMRTDVKTGMILANVVFFFIVLTTAQILFKNGITEINSPQDAALALRPLAGDWAYFLFAFGIIGTGLLAVPVLAGSGAYALCEMMKWKEGLDLKFNRARGFYFIIILSILFGLVLNFFNVNPIKALYWAAYLNGIVALPLLVAIMVVGNDKKIMGEEIHPGWVKFFGWLATVFMLLALLSSIVLSIK